MQQTWNSSSAITLGVPDELVILRLATQAPSDATTLAAPTDLKATKVDDVNRIDESNEQNNTRKATLSTGVGADLVVTSVRLKSPATAGKPITLGYNVSRKPLVPGEEVDLSIPWTPTHAGGYLVTGVVDDVDRIAELDETNNRSQPVAIEVK